MRDHHCPPTPRRSYLFSPILLALSLASAACGGGAEAQVEGTDLPAEDVQLQAAALTSPSHIVSVTASTTQGKFYPSLTIDGSLKTYWSTRRSEAWLKADLGAVRSIDGFEVAWHRGDRRVNAFSIEVSRDGRSFETVFTGKSSGNTTRREHYSFEPREARHVRLTIRGNTENDWISVSEIAAVLEGTPEPEPEPTPDGGTDPEPEPTPDGGTNPEPTPDAGTDPEPTPDAGTDPEPTPDAGTDPEPEPEPTPGETVLLPVEVLGRPGHVKSVSFNVSASDASQALTLWMHVHNLNYADKGSISLNSGAWVDLNNGTVTSEGLDRAYGGIGGGHATIKVRRAIPAGQLRAGANQLSFRFNKMDGRSNGFRVLDFNVLRADGSRVLPSSAFKQDDPSTWRAPYTDAASIAAGEQLWRTRTLRRSYDSSTNIRARCMDCHAQDGRDLKYFNYSNFSIIERSKYHGLSDDEGKKIASYIRTLNVPAPGRPWNPPYQPGPGLDAKPVDQWSAGAGLGAVLEKDRDMLAHLFPNGINKAAVSTKANLSVRNTPIAFQLPDWNHWLPGTHPKDAFGDAFINDKVNKAYAGEGSASITSNMRERAARVKAAGYGNYRSELFYPHREWGMYLNNFTDARWPSASSTDVAFHQNLYDINRWHIVKTWEVMQEFGLEGQQQKLFPSSRDARGWMGNEVFDTSPHMLHLPQNYTGINSGSRYMFHYFSNAWYQLALILYNGNHTDGADRDGQRPIDWGYAHGFVNSVGHQAEGSAPQGGLLIEWLVKGMQATDNTQGPNAPQSAGWRPRTSSDLSRLVAPEFMRNWADISTSDRRAIMEAMLSTWWDKTRSYPASDYLNGGEASRTETINGFMDGSLGNRIWFMLPQFKYHGVNPQLVDEIANWAQTIWTQADWNRVKTASCSPQGNYVRCSTESF